MDRRAFLLGVAGGFTPFIAAAQAQRNVLRIGLIGGSDPGNAWQESFRGAMRDLGRVEGRDYVLEVRWAGGDPARARAFASELVGLKVDLFVTQGSEATQAAKQATSSIPIVFSGPSYPVDEGLVASFARPGGNVTGFTVAMSDTVSKHLQLLRDVTPALADVAVVWSPANPGHRFAFRDTENAAASLRLKIQSVPLERANDLGGIVATIARLKPGALVVFPMASLTGDHARQIAEVAVRLRIPSITTFRGLAQEGLLMAYGPDVRHAPQRVAEYVDRILKGAKPADLPVERPTKFELAINLKTAKAIGLTVPQPLLLRADELIQ